MDLGFIFKSILLGTVQGLTEFLPVSSSGHLLLLQRLLHYDLGVSMTFVNVMFHIGTLFAVIFVFRKQLFALFRPPCKKLLLLGLATVPAGAVGVLFHGPIDALFSGEYGLPLLALCFLLTAVLLCAAEGCARKRGEGKPVGAAHAAAMGLIQAVALFPGISRSGSTVAAGTIAGGKRAEVAEFSFLMSIPVILGSALVEFKDVLSPGAGAFAPGGTEIAGMLLGMLAALISGFFAVRWMERAVVRARYGKFSVYLLLLAAVCLWLYAAKII